MNNGTVTMPIEQYNEMYDAVKELDRIKESLVIIDESYNNEPQVQVNVPIVSIQNAWDKVKDKYPDYELTTKHDEYTNVYGTFSKKKPVEVEPELNLD